MAKWTPPLQPVATYELDGQAVDAGETCIGVARQDGTAIDPGNYQALFETAIMLCRQVSAVQAALSAYPEAVVAGNTGSNAVTVTAGAADLANVQAIMAAQFAGQNVTVTRG